MSPAKHPDRPSGYASGDDRSTWQAETTAYGRVRLSEGTREECPFCFQGQYEDVETGLYYNRFRYYDPQGGSYISQDSIRLQGGSRLYNYSKDPLIIFDSLGLVDFYHATALLQGVIKNYAACFESAFFMSNSLPLL